MINTIIINFGGGFEMTKEQHKLLWAAGGAWLFDAMDVGLLSFVIAALAKEWHLNSGQWV